MKVFYIVYCDQRGNETFKKNTNNYRDLNHKTEIG